MTTLSQILAVEKGVRVKSERQFTDAHRATQNVDRLSGVSRTYQPREEGGDELPPESTLVQLTVADADKQVREALTRLWDVVATKDFANTTTTADVVIDDDVLVANVPPPFLLFMEKQLVGLRVYVEKLPVLDPSFKWTQDPTSGVYRTDPVVTTKTKKVPKAHVLYDATKEHPAQVQVYHEDVIAGDWTTTKFSGAVTQERKRELLERVDQLSRAVKYAREEANKVPVTDVHVGEALLDFVFDGT